MVKKCIKLFICIILGFVCSFGLFVDATSFQDDKVIGYKMNYNRTISNIY